jgi:hypothetical protein
MTIRSPEDELFRARMHFKGPPGYEPCTRPWPHAGPCAHRLKGPPPEEFVIDYSDWLERKRAAFRRFSEALPCLDPNCCYRSPMCRNCELANEATDALAGPPPYPGDYRREEKHEESPQEDD